ncbi:MAG: methyltransferase domain-containing protein [Chloroflexota bacterium]
MKNEYIASSRIPIELKKPETLPQELYWDIAYLTPTRLSSIGYQLKLAVESKASRFMEVGIGNGLLTSLLRAMNLNVITLDINRLLIPQVVGRIPELPFVERSFETVLCYEVLEHLPFEMLDAGLKEMVRVSNNYIIISLPDRTDLYESQSFRRIINKILKRNRSVPLSAEHYWEIGYQEITAEKVIEIALTHGLSLSNHFRNPHSMYHHFFVFHLH